ncbi:MAG: HAD-IB family phosphatase [Chloroflexota bacterium]
MTNATRPIALVAFDLDGTLVRGDTICLAIATHLGRRDRMLAMERLTAREAIISAREEMAGWYRSRPMSELCDALKALPLAPGAREGFQLLKDYEVAIAIVSVTWDFAVAHFARELGAGYYVGTAFSFDQPIAHFWPEDKPRYLTGLAGSLGLSLDQVAAVGDSPGDLAMLDAVGYPFFVGQTRPSEPDRLVHLPDGNILAIAKAIVRSRG